jgi:RNA polymerase sigma factor (sigma-70 family)
LASGGDKKTRTRRDYHPRVEGLEALRLLSGATQAHPLAAMAVEQDLLADPGQHLAPLGDDALASPISNATWDAALVQTHLADLLTSPIISTPASTTGTAISTTTSQSSLVESDPAAVESGLKQLNKYLNTTWYRAGMPAQIHDDSSQAVYATLLQNLGRQRFDALLADVGQWGVKEVVNRETSEGVDFFRAVDMVKKRAQRERIHQSLESVDVPSAPREQATSAARRDALREVIDQTLNPREAALIQDTLMGKTPAEIAHQWGVAPKTVSNEKTRVLQKLRDVLANHELN